MKNSKLVKVVISIILSLAVVVMANQVLAANDFTDLTNTLSGNSASNNTTTGNNTTGNNATSNNTTSNTTKNNTTNNTSVLTTNNTSSLNNTSNYNNSSLPNTGIEDTMPGVILVVILGISAVYAYKKIQLYKNI